MAVCARVWLITGALLLGAGGAVAQSNAPGSGDWAAAMEAVGLVADPAIRRNLADVTPLTYADGMGKGALATTKQGERYLVLLTVNPDRQTTCEVAGPLTPDMILRLDECEVSVQLGSASSVQIGARACADFCGMGARFDGRYISRPMVRLDPGAMGAGGQAIDRSR